MSKFTTEVRYICETEAGLTESVGYNNVNEVIKASHASVIGNYPIFDEAYREVLDTKILKHFYTREICEETVGLWKLRLNTRMNEIMPFYNKLYSSELLSFNPFYDVDLNNEHMRTEDIDNTESGTYSENRDDVENKVRSGEVSEDGKETDNGSLYRTTNEESSVSSENETVDQQTANSASNASATSKDTKNSKDRYSDTPQGGITGLENNTYLTNARIVDGTDESVTDTETGTSEIRDGRSNGSENKSGQVDGAVNEVVANEKKNEGSTKEDVTESNIKNGNMYGNRKNDGNVNTTESYLERVHGKRGGISYSRMLMEYRETFLNIDRMVINELNDLFFGLWA